MAKAQSQKLKVIPKLLRAIRLSCLDCSAYNYNEVKKCHLENCALYPYKMGLNFESQKIPCKKSLTKQKNTIKKEV